ncbi:MAG TPA: DUF1127 domain-containing protein [Rhizobiaceae bacterium]|nr:DUF1127 domain-containing protein [Rhizobiaceae bacterium]
MPHPETGVVRHVSSVLNTMIATVEAWQRRRAVADLTPHQLRDIGRAETPAPVLEVKPGLITNLMSMK